jgi:hypothetical protein
MLHTSVSTHIKPVQRKQAFIEEYRAAHALPPDAEVPSDNMSVFYKRFLDESLPVHRHYAR